ncbi:MAG: hypothetical protein ACHQD6_08065 [Steroidobacterales bacterium]
MLPGQTGRRISAGKTVFYKRVFPVIFLGAIALSLALAIATARRDGGLPLPALIVPMLALGIGWFVVRRLVSDLADEVWDEGDALRVRFGHDEERIALADIINIGYTTMVNPERVTLTVRNPGRFGKDVTFCPVRAAAILKPLSGRNPLVSELIERVDAARQR